MNKSIDKSAVSLPSLETLTDILTRVYGADEIEWLVAELIEKVEPFLRSAHSKTVCSSKESRLLTQADMALISYANSIEDGEGVLPPLAALYEMITRYGIDKAFPILHLLPFYPWDTDRGFSVKNYIQVDPSYGTWDDVARFHDTSKLMFDFPVNHASIDNPLVQKALVERHLDSSDGRYRQVAPFRDFVLAYEDDERPDSEALAKLVRPRPTPVLTRYTVIEGNDGDLRAMLGEPPPGAKVFGCGYVWTTFSRPRRGDGSEDTRQVDLNFSNPRLFLEITDILLFYISHGARFVRLDAIGYIWKNLHSSSLHEKEAHYLLEAMNIVLSWAAPEVFTIAEVNETQDRVFEYLGGEEHRESDIIYQFAHFPLAVHALLKETADYYRNWLATTNKFEGRQFITVFGSHDGMGVKPIHGFLPEDELGCFLGVLVESYQALPNYARLPGGEEIIYEVCATPWNLVNKADSDDSQEVQIKRYLVILALGLIPRGIPAFYINGLFGAANYLPAEGLDENRTVNRQIFDLSWLEEQLDNEDSRFRQVMDGVLRLIRARSRELAFAPDGQALELLDVDNGSVIAVRLVSADGASRVLVLVNLTNAEQDISLTAEAGEFSDLLSDIRLNIGAEPNPMTLEPYRIAWLKAG